MRKSPFAPRKGEIPRYARNDIGTRRNDIGAQCEGGCTRTTHPSFASFPIMAIMVQNSPFAPRKGDASERSETQGDALPAKLRPRTPTTNTPS